MEKYCYVIIDALGQCGLIRDDSTEKITGLPSLLKKGWRPVRETPFFNTLYILILLERE